MVEFSHLHCSFCGQSATEVKKLIAGPDVYICNECVDKCYGILNEGATQVRAKANSTKSLLVPREIKAFLDQYVIGQDNAKEILAVAIYNHYKRLDNPVIDDVEIDKSNCLLMGPSGSGKCVTGDTIISVRL